MTGQAVLSIHYLPCVAWFKQLLANETVVLEQYEHFMKQTYRNRCVILSANGPLALTIPIKKREPKQAVHSIEIENEFNWQKQHWEAIRSAYNNSPFFEHYEHYFQKFYTQEFNHLQSFNLELIRLCLKLMKVNKEVVLSTTYIDAQQADIDLREVIHPKKKSVEIFTPYLQVFTEKYPFTPNLSIVDLLFNQGPNWSKYV